MLSSINSSENFCCVCVLSHFVNLQPVVKHGIKLDYIEAQEHSGILHYSEFDIILAPQLFLHE